MKKMVGSVCSLLGFPSAYCLMKCTPYGYKSPDEYSYANLIMYAPAAAATLPLLPFALVGDYLLDRESERTFKERTKNFPKVHLGKEYASVEYSEYYRAWYVCHNAYEDVEEFDSEEEAEKYLKDTGYQEVVSLDHPLLWSTFWKK